MSKIDHNLEPPIGIGSDIPLSDPVADEFGYAGFADQAAIVACLNQPAYTEPKATHCVA